MGFRIDSEFLVRADRDGRERMREHLFSKHGNIQGSVIARSILSKPIEVYFIGEGKRYVTVFATHHALESITTNFAFLFIDYLMTKSSGGVINGIDCKFLLSKYRTSHCSSKFKIMLNTTTNNTQIPKSIVPII